MKKESKILKERLIKGGLMLSASVTSITVILIIVFLFTEGTALFRQSPVEKGMVLQVSTKNKVDKLSAGEVKQIFDQELVNWSKVGGANDSILLFRLDDIGNYYTEDLLGDEYQNVPFYLTRLLDSLPNMIAFVPEKYASKKARLLTVKPVSISGFLFGKEWFPSTQPASQTGVLPLLIGTFLVSILAILFALPFGLATAIYLSEIASKRVRTILKPIIELLAGIPSVVYGFFGLVVVVPIIQKTFDLAVGETALAGAIILAIMALPTIISISEDALRSTPRSLREASLSLGATQWQTIYRVVIPYASSGITAAIMLGVGRAIGETMAVIMVTGNAAVIPHTILEPVRTIPATIAAELGEAPQGGIHYQALFALGAILFMFTLLINISVQYITKRRQTK